MAKKKTYPAKLLWFGEYTVMTGGPAIAGPLHRWQGRWVTDSAFADRERLVRHVSSISFRAEIDLGRLQNHLQQHTFVSEIPMGAGAGSSAALTAAIYDCCAYHDELSLDDKCRDLGAIESLYHGRSSGFDALVSLEECTMIRQGEEIEPISLDEQPLYYYLLDSGIERQSRRLIEQYATRCRDPHFAKGMNAIAECNEEIIDGLRTSQPIAALVNRLSELQFRFMQDFIPRSIRELWRGTLVGSDIALKLCGAGGGGFFFLIATAAQEDWQGHRLIPCNHLM